MPSRKLVKSLAKTAAATAFAGPLAGASAGVNEAIDLMADWLGRRDKDSYEAALERIGRDFERFGRSERLDENLVNQALEAAQAVISRYGLTAAEITRLGLEPKRVAEKVLARAARDLALLDEGASEMCRSAVQGVYTSLLIDATALPGLEMAFRRAVLERLDTLHELPSEVAETIQAAAISAMVVNPSRRWRPDLFPPSSLLRAEFGIVPFHGRDAETAELDTWCRDARPVSVRLYTGAGGMGKTRLLIDVVDRFTAAGWRAGFLASNLGGGSPLTWLMQDSRDLLLVVDYAETRRRDVLTLIGTALESGRGTVRIVLLARAIADWWHDLLGQGAGVGDLLTGPATSVHRLGPLTRSRDERRAAFDIAARSYAGALKRAVPEATERSLDAALYDRVLFIHLAALAVVESETGDSEQSLLEFALKRERRFWDEGVRNAGLAPLGGRPIAQAAAVATLAGAADDRAAAIELISRAPLLAGQPAAVLDELAELLHRLYPGERWLQGVQPDLLGEHLVGRSVEDDPKLLGIFGFARG